MTRSEFNAELALIFGRTDLESRINRWINLAQIQVVQVHEFQNLNDLYEGSTTEDELYYSFPSQMKDIHTFRIIDGTNSRKLTRLRPDQMDSKIPAPAELSTGVPSFYLRYGNQFELWRIPDATYTMRLRASFWLTPLTGDTQSPDLDYIDLCILDKAAEIGWRSLQQTDEANGWKETFITDLGIATREDKTITDMKHVAQGFETEDIIQGQDKVTSPMWGINR